MHREIPLPNPYLVVTTSFSEGYGRESLDLTTQFKTDQYTLKNLLVPLPIDGYWSAWSATCNRTCGTGYLSRYCIGPYRGGLPCSGSTTTTCNTQLCFVPPVIQQPIVIQNPILTANPVINPVLNPVLNPATTTTQTTATIRTVSTLAARLEEKADINQNLRHLLAVRDDNIILTPADLPFPVSDDESPPILLDALPSSGTSNLILNPATSTNSLYAKVSLNYATSSTTLDQVKTASASSMTTAMAGMAATQKASAITLAQVDADLSWMMALRYLILEDDTFTLGRGFVHSPIWGNCPMPMSINSTQKSTRICSNTPENLHGLCINYKTNPTCICAAGFLGTACEKPCPGVFSTKGVCSGAGTCYMGPGQTAMCNCSNGSLGEFCQLICPKGDCPPSSTTCTCSNMGSCNAASAAKYKCNCNPIAFGNDCSDYCPSTVAKSQDAPPWTKMIAGSCGGPEKGFCNSYTPDNPFKECDCDGDDGYQIDMETHMCKKYY